MQLKRLVNPAIEPITLEEAKNHLRLDVDFTEDDALIESLIRAARGYAEMKTNRSFITQTWMLILDAFPGPTLSTPLIRGETYSIPRNAIALNRGPVQSITSISYLGMDGNWATHDLSKCAIDLDGEPARITPKFGQIWPITLPQIACGKVTFVAGFGDAPSSVPEGIKQWMKIRVASLYENREETVLSGRGNVVSVPFINRLLDDETVPLV